MKGHKQAVHMKNWQRVNQHIARLPTPVVLEHQRVAKQVAVRQRRTLAAAGGAAGVQNRRQIVFSHDRSLMLVTALRGAYQQRTSPVIIQGEHVLRTGLESNLADPTKVLAATNHHCRIGIFNKVLDFRTLVSSVKRQKYIARAQSREVQHHGLDGFFNLYCHSRTGWKF